MKRLEDLSNEELRKKIRELIRELEDKENKVIIHLEKKK